MKLEIGNSGYLITEKGEVISPNGLALKPFDKGTGYLQVSINGNKHLIHQLVADYFIPKPDNINNWTVDHIDENKKNNDAYNLQWLTLEDNIRKSLKFRGITKLSDEAIPFIRDLIFEGNSTKVIGELLGVSSGTIASVARLDTWSHIPAPEYYLEFIKEYSAKKKVAQFSDEQVLEIRRLSRTMNNAQVAKIFNTGKGTIWNIVNYKNYRHLP